MDRHAVFVLTVAVSAAVSFSDGRASCSPSQQFSQFGAEEHFVLFPPGTPATSESIVGRFWQPGQHSGAGEGACNDAAWLLPCGEYCPATSAGPAFVIGGFTGSDSCPSGCPSGEMILLLQEQGSAPGGMFAVARVTETVGSPAFDFSRIQRDVTLAPIPRPRVITGERVGTNYRFHLQFDDPGAGFFGLPGVPATSTITAINVYTKVATDLPTMPPPLQRTAWTFRQRLPYVGGTTSTTLDVAPEDMCIGGGYAFQIVSAIELDGGQVVTDYVSQSTVISSCIPETVTGASDVPDGSLHVSRTAPGDLALSWSTTCFPAAGAFYSVYEGTLGDWTSHLPRACSVSGTTTSFPEPAGNSYYLVVPYAPQQFYPELPPRFEGSYGIDGAGNERPPSVQACGPQSVRRCP